MSSNKVNLKTIYMKNLIFLFIFLPIFAFGQISKSEEITYEVSKPYPFVDGLLKFYFFQNGEMLSIKAKGLRNTYSYNYVYQKFDSQTLKLKKSGKWTNVPKNHVFEDIRKVGNKFYFFYSLAGDYSYEQLFCIEIDFNTGNLIGEARNLLKTNGKVPAYGSKFNFTRSLDSTKLLVKCDYQPEKRNDHKNHATFGFYAFNSNMESIWKKDIKMPYTERRLKIYDFIFDHEANIIFSTLVFNDDSRKCADGNCKKEMIKIDAKDQSITSFELSIPKMNVLGFDFTVKNQKLICIGTCNVTGIANQYITGIFKAELKENKLVNPVTHLIPRKYFEIYGEKEEKERGFEYLNIFDLELKKDGSFYLIGEKRHSYGTSERRYSFYKQVLISKINSNGSLAWINIINKDQEGGSSQANMGYKYYFGKNDNLHLFVVDNLKNKDLKEGEKPKTHSGSYMIKGGIAFFWKIDDKDGSAQRIPILDLGRIPELDEKAVGQFWMKKIINTGKSGFIIECNKKNENVILKFMIN